MFETCRSLILFSSTPHHDSGGTGVSFLLSFFEMNGLLCAHVNMRECTLYTEGWAHSHICTAITWLQSKGTLKRSFLKAVCASCSFPISPPSLPFTLLLPPPPSIHLCLPNSITVNHVSHPDTFLFHQAVGQYSLTLP